MLDLVVRTSSTLVLVLVPTIPVVLHRAWPHFRHGSLDQYWVTADVFPLHVSRCLEVVIAAREANESKSFALRGTFIANNSCFLYRWIFCKCFQKRFISDFTCEITNEDSKMCWIPFEEGIICPCCAAS